MTRVETPGAERVGSAHLSHRRAAAPPRRCAVRRPSASATYFETIVKVRSATNLPNVGNVNVH